MRVKLSNKYDSKSKSSTRSLYTDNNNGFEGIYTHKDLGKCEVFVCEIFVNKTIKDYHLRFDVWIDGIEYQRSFECSGKPSHKLAGLKALQFLRDLKVNKNDV